jgi:membrane protein implicated in regulation of membrane protease activity
MHIVFVAWVFVVALMALVEATSSQGTLLGAFFTLLLYGALPLSIVMYVLGTPARKRKRLLAQQESAAPPTDADQDGEQAKSH